MSAYQGINLENNFDIEIALQNFKIFDEEYLKTIFETFQDYIYVKESTAIDVYLIKKSQKNYGFYLHTIMMKYFMAVALVMLPLVKIPTL